MNLYTVRTYVVADDFKFGEFRDFIVAALNQNEAEERVKEYTKRPIQCSALVLEGTYIVGNVFLRTRNV